MTKNKFLIKGRSILFFLILSSLTNFSAHNESGDNWQDNIDLLNIFHTKTTLHSYSAISKGNYFVDKELKSNKMFSKLFQLNNANTYHLITHGKVENY